MSNTKDTVYVDVDDDITSIIDKVRSSDKKIVALVLPKRAAVLQSSVNMKLLKRSAETQSKNIVLITSEAAVLPLAGAAGIHVAKTLQSKPVIPVAPASSASGAGDDQVDDDFELDANATKPVGELAGDDADETIEVDNDPDAKKVVAGAAAVAATKKAKSSKGKDGKKKFRIPDFDTFRKRLLLGIGIFILLIIGWYVAFKVMPQAKVVVVTDTTVVPTELSLTANPTAQSLNEEDGVVPAKNQELKKTDSEKAPATGEKDLGTKASGTVSLQNCSQSTSALTVPAGTSVSTAGLTYVTQEAVTLPATTLNGLSQCTTPTKDVSVIAQNGGDKYNIDGDKTFTVSGYSSVKGVDSSPMTGGTSNIVKIVTQSDIDSARTKAIDKMTAAAKDELKKSLTDAGYIPLEETLASGAPTVTSNPTVDQQGNEVTVTVTITFSMLGMKKEDVQTMVEKTAEGKIDKSKQVILDNGLDKATFKVTERKANNVAVVQVNTEIVAGSDLNQDAIKAEVAGKKKGEAIETVQARPGVKEVTITYSPFWVSKTPSNQSKIQVTFEQNNTNDNTNP